MEKQTPLLFSVMITQLFVSMCLINNICSQTISPQATSTIISKDDTAAFMVSPTTSINSTHCCGPCAKPRCKCDRRCTFEKMAANLSFLHTPLMLISCGVGLIGNMAVLIVAYKHRKDLSDNNIILSHIASEWRNGYRFLD